MLDMMRARVLAMLTDTWGANGGIAQYNRDFVCALAASEAVERVDVIAYSRASTLAQLPPAGISFQARGGRAGFSAASLAAARGHDVVFCGHIHLAPLASLVARRARALLWLQVHGVEAWSRPSRLRREALERAALVTAVSRYTRERVCAWASVDPGFVRVLPNTVDTTLFGFEERVGKRPPVILSVGRLSAGEKYKGHDRVIPLLPCLRSRHPGLRYRIVGDGDDRSRLSALAIEHGVAEIVEFVGHVPRKRLPIELHAASVFVMPSTGEGFGIAFLEALVCGTPAVGLDRDGSRDALGDGDLGIVTTEHSLFEAIDSALAGSIDSKAMARHAADRYSPNRFRAHVEALARELLSSRSRGSTIR